MRLCGVHSHSFTRDNGLKNMNKSSVSVSLSTLRHKKCDMRTDLSLCLCLDLEVTFLRLTEGQTPDPNERSN